MKEDIDQLRKLIRELGLEWLDEELEEILTTGKLQQKDIFEGRRKTSKGIEQVPYSDNEQLDIIINSLRNYFITLPLVQNELEKSLMENLKIKKVSFIEDKADDFQKISRETQKLDSLLNEVLK